jgi:hypothetical protein
MNSSDILLDAKGTLNEDKVRASYKFGIKPKARGVYLLFPCIFF